jgi:hypothetical protein
MTQKGNAKGSINLYSDGLPYFSGPFGELQP